MSLIQLPHAHPRVIVFDWHATLANTMDAMYHAIDEVFPSLSNLGLIDRLVKPEDSKTVEDAKLVRYVREYGRLHPKIKAQQKISRTDIFEVLFGADQEAKRIAHRAFDSHYGKYFGEVKPMEANAGRQLQALRDMGIRLGVLSNRARVFMEHELAVIDGGGWDTLFDTLVCGDDVEHRKPHPDLILRAIDNLHENPDQGCWYVGDSTTDIIAAKRAGVTAVFYNGQSWDQPWLDKIFPGTVRHPHTPDAVVDTLAELVPLARRLLYMSRTNAK